MSAVITNSLASTDGILVHSKYRRYRKTLLPAGVDATEFALLVSWGSGAPASETGISGTAPFRETCSL